ncbi:MAG: class I SAM-dependent rRNA methyltransferase [Oscillospiraceae bacterium]|nr:class I SAM-dependent rRNA methyltransferase [Oscillospiraceae bacterium]
MPADRNYTKIYVTPKVEKSLRNGHPWVFQDEVTAIDGTYENGQLVDVLSSKDKYLGTGFINDNSKILVRVVSTNTNDSFDRAFYERRIRYALNYRRTVMPNEFNCCRLIFGEADGIPGITVDRYDSVLVIQSLCLGTDLIKPMLIEILLVLLAEMGESIDTVYERNDLPVREREGMQQYTGFYEADNLKTDSNGKIIITENGIRFQIDYINGQKTGYYLDQKYNRLAVAKISKDRNVLDCFCHTGSFALNAAQAGAASVTAVDVSKAAINLVQENAKLNNLQRNMTYVNADVFEFLTELSRSSSHPYDLIILDPPAFTKSSSRIKNAIGGYRQINQMAMRILPRGGYLATCSCSHFVTDTHFRALLRQAATDVSVSLRQIEARQQAPDHPILWNVPETNYLKFYIFQVI